MHVFEVVCFTDAPQCVSDFGSPLYFMKETLLMYDTPVITAHMGMSHKNISFL